MLSGKNKMEEGATLTIQFLLGEKLANAKIYFMDEIIESGIKEEVDKLTVESLVAKMITAVPYWDFIERGQTDILISFGELADNETTNRACAFFKKMKVEKKEKLLKYVQFFLSCVKSLSK